MGFLIDFFVVGIILKMLAQWAIKRSLKWTRAQVDNPEHNKRYYAIYNHFQKQAAGAGHKNDVSKCGQDNCIVFAT